MCRQFMAELCGGDFRIVLTDRTYTLKDLLPFTFSL
jgi:cytidine deaminase